MATLLVLIAVVLFGLAAFNVQAKGIHLGWLGAAVYAAVGLLAAFP
jgi:hypothetical protein